MDLHLSGKVALVTAASKGLGKATARQFALEGAKVVICARSQLIDLSENSKARLFKALRQNFDVCVKT